MAPSSHDGDGLALPWRALLALGVLASTVAACDKLLGLGDYSNVDCASDCGVDGGAGGGDDVGTGDAAVGDATIDSSPAEASDDADAAADADAPESPPPPPWDGGTPVDLWARWPMPNPDAAIAPDSAVSLPNPMAYDAGADGGAATAVDLVTGLAWHRASLPASDVDAATDACAALGAGWHVPTRIQLVSLIDFTRSPAVDPGAFPNAYGDRYWTSSVVPGDAGLHWVVDLNDGLAAQVHDRAAAYVLCAQGGGP